MKVKEIEKRPTEIITDIRCDICSGSCKVQESDVDNPARLDHGYKLYGFEYMELKATWGYASENDLSKWTAHICEKCVMDTLAKLINFKKENYHPFTPQ